MFFIMGLADQTIQIGLHWILILHLFFTTTHTTVIVPESLSEMEISTLFSLAMS